MRISDAINTAASAFTTDEAATTDATQTAPAPAPQTLADTTAAPSEGKRLEGQLDAFLFRNQLSTGQNDAASGTKQVSGVHNFGASGGPTFAGMRLGINNFGEEVRVTKDLGPPQGYDSRLQAIAAARMTGADPTAVIQSNDGKWHPVETNANFAGGLQAAADTPTRAVEGLPSSASIDKVIGEIAKTREELGNLDPSSPDDRRKRDRLTEDLQHQEKELASLVFGVPESEIQFNRSPDDDTPGKINIDPGSKMPGVGDTHEANGGTAISISLEKLEHPKAAAGTLFHELSHLHDSQLAKEWLGKFKKETFGDKPISPKDFQDWVKTPKGGKALHDWLDKQPGLSKADAEVVKDAAAGQNVSTEARAYVHSAITAMKSGNFEALADQLKSYAAAIRKGQTANPLNGSETLKTLTQELRNAYQHLSPTDRDKFDAAVKKAHDENPNLWISNLDFKKK